MIAAMHAKQALRGQLIRGWEIRDGVRVQTFGVLVGHDYVPLTPEQVADLKQEIPNG